MCGGGALSDENEDGRTTRGNEATQESDAGREGDESKAEEKRRPRDRDGRDKGRPQLSQERFKEAAGSHEAREPEDEVSGYFRRSAEREQGFRS